MRLAPLVSLFVSAAGLPLSAQTVVLLQTPPAQSCPVDLLARHGVDSGLVAVRQGEKSPLEGYRLSFFPHDPHTVVAATVRLHGLAGPTVYPARQTSGIPGTTEQLTLAPIAGATRRSEVMLYPVKLTGVQWIEVESLRYADGASWHRSSDSRCTVVPNGFLLTAAVSR